MRGKNIHPCAGRPLIAWTCEAAAGARKLAAAIVSTDSPEIASAVRNCGVEAPFLRPPEISGDDTPSLDVVLHALGWLKRERDQTFDAVALLQPTSPLRRAEHIDAAAALFEASGADTVVSVCRPPKQMQPGKMMVEVDGRLEPFVQHPEFEDSNAPQTVVVRDGPSILIAREAVLRSGGFYSGRTLGFEMPWDTFVDIDLPEDLQEAERRLLLRRRSR